MHASPLRCFAVWLAATAGTVALVGWLVADLAPAERFDQVLARVAAAVAALCVAWLWVLATAVVVEAATGTSARGVPAPIRRLVLAACGAAVLTGLAVPVQATPGDLHRDRRPAAVLAGLPFPDRAAGLPGGARIGTGPMRHSPAPDAEVVVVRPGDTLWDLADADLGPGADAAAIDARWREIYALNRGVIGPDPDLIQPAQRLCLPVQQ